MTEPEDPTQAIPEAAVIAGRYRLDTLCGRGGTAEVWRATDTSLDRVVALKLVTIAHDESSSRAADEARTLARLSHPSLVQVYDAGTDTSGRPWVVMEFIDGETLADAIRRGPLAVQRINEIGLAVADALDHVHAQGMVHRDVKPANVLMGRGGKTKLTDFGIARLVDAAKVTTTGMMVGTASYLAPEQVAGEPVGPPADVYALGLVLLEALTGKREYEGPAVEAAMARLHRPPVVPLSLGAGWAPLVTAMTSRYAEQRPTAGQVADALRAQLGGRTTTLVPPATQAIDRTQVIREAVPTAVPLPRPAPARNRGKALVAGILAAVVLLGVGGVVISQQQSMEPRTVPAISSDLPGEISSPLREIVRRVQQ